MFDQEALDVGKALKPIYSQVILVKDEESERRSKGGIILNQQDAPTHYVGQIVAIGNGKITQQGEIIPPQVKVGDKVRYRIGLVDEFKYEGHDYVALDETEIICVLP